MIELFGSALVTFLVIIDPPGCAPIFASLTRGATAAHRRAMAIRSSLIAWGDPDVLRPARAAAAPCARHRLASFRIAGGIMLFFIALDMVFERRTERREKRAEEIERHARGRGHQRVPDGDADDRRAGLDRQRDAVGVARRGPGRIAVVLAALTW